MPASPPSLPDVEPSRGDQHASPSSHKRHLKSRASASGSSSRRSGHRRSSTNRSEKSPTRKSEKSPTRSSPKDHSPRRSGGGSKRSTRTSTSKTPESSKSNKLRLASGNAQAIGSPPLSSPGAYSENDGRSEDWVSRKKRGNRESKSTSDRSTSSNKSKEKTKGRKSNNLQLAPGAHSSSDDAANLRTARKGRRHHNRTSSSVPNAYKIEEELMENTEAITNSERQGDDMAVASASRGSTAAGREDKENSPRSSKKRWILIAVVLLD